MGEEEETPEDPLLTEARRALKFQLACVQNGVAGALKIAPQHQTLPVLKTFIEELLASLDEEELTWQTLLESIDERIVRLSEAFGIEIEKKKESSNPMQNRRRNVSA